MEIETERRWNLEKEIEKGAESETSQASTGLSPSKFLLHSTGDALLQSEFSFFAFFVFWFFINFYN